MTLIVHGEAWDEIPMGGDVMSKACLISFKRNGRVAAVALGLAMCGLKN